MSGKTTDEVKVALKLQRAKQFQGGMNKSAKSVRGVGKETEEASRKARLFNETVGKTNGLMGRGAKMALGFAGGLVAIGGIKKSVDTTAAFAKSTMTLNGAFKLGVEDASRWAAAASVRELSIQTLSVAFNKNAKMVEQATAGYGKQRRALALLGGSEADLLKRQTILSKGAGAQAEIFKQLGISRRDLANGRNDMNGLLLKEIDGWSKIKSATKRVNIAQLLWGRGWQKLRPLLAGGSKALKEQLGLADKYGVTLNGKTIKGVQDLIAAERESKYASLGLQLALGQGLIPVITKVTSKSTKLIHNLRSGGGKWKEWRDRIKSVTKWMKRHEDVVTSVAVTIGTLVIFAQLTSWVIGATAAFAAFNAILLANPVGVAVAAVVALGFAFYVAYQKVGWFRKGVDSVFTFINKYGPYFMAPFTMGLSLVIPQVIKHFDEIVGFVKALPGRIAKAAVGMWDFLKTGAIAALNRVIDMINKVIGAKVFGHQLGARIPNIKDPGASDRSSPPAPDHSPLRRAPRRRDHPSPSAVFGPLAPVTVESKPQIWLDGRDISSSTLKRARDRSRRR